jgi:hypothetical protein
MLMSTRSKAASYSSQLVLTGSPIATDSAPTNLASVSSGRRVSYPAGFLGSSAATMCAFALDGTGAVVRFWWYDLSQDLWVPNATTGTLTAASTNSLVQSVGYMPGALFHCQVISNAGSVTKIAVLIR